MKTTITAKQVEQFNKMRATLIRISKLYETPDQLRRDSNKEYGLDYTESLEMAYENIQMEAKAAAKGTKTII